MEFLFAASLCLLLALFFLRPVRRRNMPPGPLPFPVVGNIPHLGAKPHKSLAALAKVHGPILSLKLGTLNAVVVSSPELAKQVLQTHDLSLCNRSIIDSVRACDHHQYSMAWIPVSPLWRALRKLSTSQIFAAQKLDSTRSLRAEQIRKLVGRVRESCLAGKAVDVGQAAFDTSINLLSNTIFSVDLVGCDSPVGEEYKRLVREIVEEMGKPNLGDYFPIIRRLDLQKIRRQTTIYFGKFFDIFEGFYSDRLEQRNRACASALKNDVLDILIDVVEDKREDIDRNIAMQLLLDLFVAGTETTSSTLEWAMAELLHNPEVLLKAKAELEKVIGRDNEVQESDVVALPYLHAIMKETLRLHPPTPLLIPREAVVDVEIGGFLVPQGTQVMVNAWAIGRDTSSWENPHRFNPERFLGSSIDVKGTDFELLPFGAGRRICPGLMLAMRMLHLMLSSLLNAFNWRLEQGLSSESLSMEDKFAITLHRAEPLRALPLLE